MDEKIPTIDNAMNAAENAAEQAVETAAETAEAAEAAAAEAVVTLEGAAEEAVEAVEAVSAEALEAAPAEAVVTLEGAAEEAMGAAPAETVEAAPAEIPAEVPAKAPAPESSAEGPEEPVSREKEADEEASPEAPKKKMKTWKKALLGVLIGLLVLIIGVGTAAFLYIKSKYDKIHTLETQSGETIYVNPDLTNSRTAPTTSETEPSTTDPAGTKETESASSETETTAETGSDEDTTESVDPSEYTYTTLMFYGVDARNNHDLIINANADSEMICVICDQTHEVKLISILRDTFVETPSGVHNKLTDIYAAYGVVESLGTINKNFDLAITKYVTVNWKDVADVVTMLGGIDVYLTKAEVDYINRYRDLIESVVGQRSQDIEYVGDGFYHLDGVQTVRHAANRSVGLHDISRAQRQQAVVRALLSKAKSCSLSQLDAIIDRMLPGISTNLTLLELLGYAANVTKYTIGETRVFPFHYTDQSDLRTAYVYCTSLADNVIQLHQLLYGKENYVPSDTVYGISEYINQYRRAHP